MGTFGNSLQAQRASGSGPRRAPPPSAVAAAFWGAPVAAGDAPVRRSSPRRAGVRYRSKFFHDGRKVRRRNLTQLRIGVCVAAARPQGSPPSIVAQARPGRWLSPAQSWSSVGDDGYASRCGGRRHTRRRTQEAERIPACYSKPVLSQRLMVASAGRVAVRTGPPGLAHRLRCSCRQREFFGRTPRPHRTPSNRTRLVRESLPLLCACRDTFLSH